MPTETLLGKTSTTSLDRFFCNYRAYATNFSQNKYYTKYANLSPIWRTMSSDLSWSLGDTSVSVWASAFPSDVVAI